MKGKKVMATSIVRADTHEELAHRHERERIEQIKKTIQEPVLLDANSLGKKSKKVKAVFLTQNNMTSEVERLRKK